MHLRTAFRVAVVALGCFVGVPVLSLIGAHAYLAYEAHLAGILLRDLQSLKIGQSESSALWVSRKYGGVQWVNKFQPDYDRSDYTYDVQINPWFYDAVPGKTPTGIHRTLRSFVKKTPPAWRHALGLRKWLVGGDIRIKAGIIDSVSGVMVAEGKDKWLGAEWNLVAAVPPDRLQQFWGTTSGTRTFSVNGGHLLWDDEGQFLEAWITPATEANDASALRELNVRCLNFRCAGFHELMPAAATEYNSHP
jgi:hypothetical protein